MSLHIKHYQATTTSPIDPIVLLHGWGVNGKSWQPLLPSLQKIADVWVVDLPGFGLSKTISEFSSSTILKQLKEQLPERMCLLGWSLGGILAVEFAAMNPTRISKLITLAANACFVEKKHWPKAMPKAVNKTFNRSFASNYTATLKHFYTLLAQGSLSRRELIKNMSKECALTTENINPAWAQALEHLSACDNTAAFKSLRVAGLHLLAENDALVPVAAAIELKALNAKQQLEVVPNACHALHWDYPELVMEKITKFLSVTYNTPQRDKQQVARAFSRAALSYDSVAHLQRKVGEALLELVPGNKPVVLDLGVGTGFLINSIIRKTKASDFVALDLAEGMLHFARKKHTSAITWVCGDAEYLPFVDKTYDLIFSNLALQWCEDLPQLFSELHRILKPGGCLVFSTLCEGTLKELQNAWHSVNGYVHVNSFNSRRTIKEHVCAAGFTGVTQQQETQTLHYKNFPELAHELKALGAHNVNYGRPEGLTSRAQLARLTQAYEACRTKKGLPLTYEVIYMQAVREA